MTNVISKVKMRTPSCSAFPFSFRNRFSSRIGQLTPVACIEMGPNDRLKMSMAHLSRLMPLSSPAMANFRLDVDAVFVPARIIAKKYERFFNPATPDQDRPYFPSLTYHWYTEMLIKYVGLFNKSLLDYLGYPTFENAKDFFRKLVTTSYFINSDRVKCMWYDPDATIPSTVADLPSIYYGILDDTDDMIHCYTDDGEFTGTSIDTASAGVPFFIETASGLDIPNFLSWLVCTDQGVEVSPTLALQNHGSFMKKYGSVVETFGYSYTNTVGDLVEQYLNATHKHMDALVDEYLSWCVAYLNEDSYFHSGVYTLPSYHSFEQVLYCKDKPGMIDSLKLRDKKLSLLPLFSFWKCYFDWYVNSVLEHGEDLTEAWSCFVQAVIEMYSAFAEDQIYSFDEYIGSASFDSYYADLLMDFFGIADPSDVFWRAFCTIPSRLWAIDRFTGAYTDTQNGNPVLIPVDGTIRDITASNVLQRLLTKEIFGGTRTIDKNEIIYGARSSNQLLDRTEVLCRKKFNIDIQQVTNSAKSDQFDLGTLGGNGFGMGSDFLFDYTCEERGTILIFASVVLPPSYVQAMDRCLMHTDFYDFVLPEFDQIGEQEIAPEELYFDKGMNFAPIGYNRRYYENIDMLSSVHGDFKNVLRYWHDARFFKNAPSLSPEFIRIDPENDDLERIFATYTYDQILNFFAFSGVVVRPMSKYVQYGTL